tara:strand:+ start:101 stop:496 length:396 start_codon:yes stop_codon:yes gene_type:complete
VIDGCFYFPQLRDVIVSIATKSHFIFLDLGMPLRLIPNEQLLLERIPDPEGDLRGWERFAHTINGYEVMGGFEPCADLANRGTPTTFTELRCCLFSEARRERHSGGFSSNDQQIRALLRAIRQNVANGEFA